MSIRPVNPPSSVSPSQINPPLFQRTQARVVVHHETVKEITEAERCHRSWRHAPRANKNPELRSEGVRGGGGGGREGGGGRTDTAGEEHAAGGPHKAIVG